MLWSGHLLFALRVSIITIPVNKEFNTLRGIYLTWAMADLWFLNGMPEGCWHLGSPGLLFHNHIFMVPTAHCFCLAVHLLQVY